MKLKLNMIALPALVVTALFLAQATTAAAEGEDTDGHPGPAVTQGNGGAGRLAELLRIAPLPDGARDALLRVIEGAGLSEQGPGLHAPSNGHGPRALCRQFAGNDNVPEPIAERCERLHDGGDGPHPCDRASAVVDATAASIARRCHDAPGQQRPAFDGAGVDRLPRPSRPAGVPPVTVDPAVN